MKTSNMIAKVAYQKLKHLNKLGSEVTYIMQINENDQEVIKIFDNEMDFANIIEDIELSEVNIIRLDNIIKTAEPILLKNDRFAMVVDYIDNLNL